MKNTTVLFDKPMGKRLGNTFSCRVESADTDRFTLLLPARDDSRPAAGHGTALRRTSIHE